jgi:hypothetical protein
MARDDDHLPADDVFTSGAACQATRLGGQDANCLE